MFNICYNINITISTILSDWANINVSYFSVSSYLKLTQCHNCYLQYQQLIILAVISVFMSKEDHHRFQSHHLSF